ncbi:prepilin peptidase [Escherichia coli]|uniref:prepilin peptidase n=1 Tax=Escherichia coli TaxID=562 RepID=UPI003CC83BBE
MGWGCGGGGSAGGVYWGYRILRHKEGLGYGDVKFLAALGAWCTWHPCCHDWCFPCCLSFACGPSL